MGAFSILIFLSTIKFTVELSFIKNVTVSEGQNITLVGINTTDTKRITSNITWETQVGTRRQNVCNLNLTKYICEGVNLTIINCTEHDSKPFYGESYTTQKKGYTQGYFIHNYAVYYLKVIMSTTPATTATTVTVITLTTKSMLRPKAEALNFLTNVQTAETHATSNPCLTTNATVASLVTPLKHISVSLQLQITFLIVMGITILAVLLYYIFCRQIPNVQRRPIYRPIIGEPQQLQVEGGLRNLMFSFTVW